MTDDPQNTSSVAIAQSYMDDESRKLIMYLSNGVVCAIPPNCVQALDTVEQSELSEMVISEDGNALQWPGLGLELSLAEIFSAATQG